MDEKEKDKEIKEEQENNELNEIKARLWRLAVDIESVELILINELGISRETLAAVAQLVVDFQQKALAEKMPKEYWFDMRQDLYIDLIRHLKEKEATPPITDAELLPTI